MGEGGHVRGWIEGAEVEVEEIDVEKQDEEEEEMEEVDEVGLWQRDGRLRLRFKSEKLGMWKRRCERIVV
jgi:hypothetical protein